MELKINEYQVTPEITFNFEELKTEVAERVAYYKDLVYTDEQIKEAKADRAALRKFVDALDTRRKELKAEILRPYTEFETKLDEIKALLNEPIRLIDLQIKEYEEHQKEEKRRTVLGLFHVKNAEWMADVIWNPKWLNVTYSLKSIEEEIDARLFNYETDMKIIDSLDEFRFEATEEYKKTLDLGRAMIVVNQLKEQAKRKAEYEEAAKRKAEETTENDAGITPEPVPEEPKVWLSFKAYVTKAEAMELKKFLEDRNIVFKAV